MMKRAIILAAAVGLRSAPALAQGAGGGGGGGASSQGGLSRPDMSPTAGQTARKPMRSTKKMMKSRSKKKMMRARAM